MKRGDLVVVSSSSHMYPDGWKSGEHPTYIPDSIIGLVLDAKYEESTANPRLFLRIMCSKGIGYINSAWCKVLR